MGNVFEKKSIFNQIIINLETDGQNNIRLNLYSQYLYINSITFILVFSSENIPITFYKNFRQNFKQIFVKNNLEMTSLYWRGFNFATYLFNSQIY